MISGLCFFFRAAPLRIRESKTTKVRIADVTRVHPLLEGINMIGKRYRCHTDWNGFYESVYNKKIRNNWLT
jgi:hypothetical protein